MQSPPDREIIILIITGELFGDKRHVIVPRMEMGLRE